VVGVFGIAIPGADLPRARAGEQLSPRQLDVLRLLVQAKSTNQIADELHLATETVRNHIRSLLRTLGAHSRLEATLIALREGLGRPRRLSARQPTGSAAEARSGAGALVKRSASSARTRSRRGRLGSHDRARLLGRVPDDPEHDPEVVELAHRESGCRVIRRTFSPSGRGRFACSARSTRPAIDTAIQLVLPVRTSEVMYVPVPKSPRIAIAASLARDVSPRRRLLERLRVQEPQQAGEQHRARSDPDEQREQVHVEDVVVRVHGVNPLWSGRRPLEARRCRSRVQEARRLGAWIRIAQPSSFTPSG